MGHVESRGIARARRAKPRDVASLLHELREHQTELDMQNAALREAQAELEASRVRYRDLYELAPISYLTLAADGTILEANRAAQSFFKLAHSELVGRRVSRFVVAEHVTRFARHRRAVLSSNQQLHCYVDVEVGSERRTLRLESVRTGGTHEWSTTLVDLTDLHRFEQLSRERTFLSTVIDTAGLLVVLDPQGRVVRPNAGCVQLIGDAGDMTGGYFWDVFAAASARGDVRRRFEAFVATGERGEWECAVPGPQDGSERFVSWRGALLRGANGDVEYVIASGTDLTERRRLEAQLLVADRLAAMGTLAAGVGHEINNPLAYTMLSLERAAKLLRGAEQELPASCRGLPQLLATAHEGADRIRHIIDDLRSLTAKDQGPSQRVDVHAVLDSCLRVAENQMRYRARLIKDYRCSRSVIADYTRLSQVFLNVILNAAEAIPDGHPAGNTIRIRTRDHGRNRVVIEIQDSGGGIEPGSLEHIFEPFFTTKAQGTGLGLPICYEIVTRMGGSISASSAPAKSTEFRIELPASERVAGASRRDSTRKSAPPAAPAPLDILIVDDEIQLATSIAALLPQHRVRIASNPKEALAACEVHDFALILCDVLMPEGCGTDLHDALAVQRPGMEECIVFMTGGAFTVRASDALVRLPNRVLQKPFDLDELLEVVASFAPKEPEAAASAGETGSSPTQLG